MEGEITTRWINLWEATPDELAQIDFVFGASGFTPLSTRTTRVLVAEVGKRIVAFHILQLVPHAEPQWVSEEYRGTGLAGEMADAMVEFLRSMQSRGWFVVADSPHAEVLCRRHGMELLKSPVYVAKETA